MNNLSTLEWIGIALMIFNGSAILFTLWFIWAARQAVIDPNDYQPTMPFFDALMEDEYNASH